MKQRRGQGAFSTDDADETKLIFKEGAKDRKSGTAASTGPSSCTPEHILIPKAAMQVEHLP